MNFSRTRHLSILTGYVRKSFFYIVVFLAFQSCVTEYPDGKIPPEPISESKVWMLNEFLIIPTWKKEELSIPMILAHYEDEPPMRFLITDIPPVGRQGRQASGTAWASGYTAMTYLMRKKYNADSSYVCSPAFIYNQLNDRQNKGIEIYRALELLKTRGCPHFENMPYREYDYMYHPSIEATTDAYNYRVTDYGRVDYVDLTQIRAHLLQGNIVIVTVAMFENIFELDSLVWEQPVGRPMGLHTVALIGYDNYEEQFIFMNSAGREWGKDGYGAIPYAWFLRLASNAYVIW